MTSLKNDVEVYSSNPLLPPTSPTSGAYSKALGALGRPMINSLTFTIGAVLLSVLLGSILGYIFSKFKFRYHNLVFLIIVAGTFLPYTTIVYALVRLISGLHLYATIPGLILTHTAYGIPVCAFMFRNFYADIPQNTIDKARKRGDGDWGIYRKIILPASGTAIITVVMFQFTSIWNDFLFGLFLGGGPTQAEPATVALAGLAGSHTNLLMAGAMLVFLPVFLLYVFMGRYFVRYLTAPSETPEKEIEPTPELE
jgi:glucose/mannose transport system permease protein